jgi:hypothetical protein
MSLISLQICNSIGKTSAKDLQDIAESLDCTIVTFGKLRLLLQNDNKAFIRSRLFLKIRGHGFVSVGYIINPIVDGLMFRGKLEWDTHDHDLQLTVLSEMDRRLNLGSYITNDGKVIL